MLEREREREREREGERDDKGFRGPIQHSSWLWNMNGRHDKGWMFVDSFSLWRQEYSHIRFI